MTSYQDAKIDYQHAKASVEDSHPYSYKAISAPVNQPQRQQPQGPTTGQEIAKWGGRVQDGITAVNGARSTYDAVAKATQTAIESGATAEQAAKAGEAAGAGEDIPYLQIATTGYGAYKGATAKGVTQEQRTQAVENAVTSSVMNYYTGGLYGLGEKYAPKEAGYARKAVIDYNPYLAAFKYAFDRVSISGHGKQRRERDAVRKGLMNNGLIDDKYGLTLADGSKYDFGADGDTKLQNKDGTTRDTYHVDWKDPLVGQAVGWANPIAQVFTNGDRKRSDVVNEMLTNAFTSGAKNLDDVKANVNAFMQKTGIDPKTLKDHLAQISAANKDNITDQELAAYNNGIDELTNPNFHGKTYAPPGQPGSAEQSATGMQQVKPLITGPQPFNPATAPVPQVYSGRPLPVTQLTPVPPLQLQPQDYGQQDAWKKIAGTTR